MTKYQLGKRLSLSGESDAKGDTAIEVYTAREWRESGRSAQYGFEDYDAGVQRDYSVLDMFADYSRIVLAVPDKTGDSEKLTRVVCYVRSDALMLIDDEGLCDMVLAGITRYKTFPNPSSGALLCEFLEQLIIDDIEGLAAIEDDLDELESDVRAEKTEGFDERIIFIRRQLLARHRYYTITSDLIGELSENENCIFPDDCGAMFTALCERTERLESNVRMLREYSVQVRETYRSHIDLRQNNIMRILTVVTVIFMPPTLIAGWYGMNFRFMPELNWQWGYAGVALFTAAVVGLLIWWLRRNKFW